MGTEWVRRASGASATVAGCGQETHARGRYSTRRVEPAELSYHSRCHLATDKF